MRYTIQAETTIPITPPTTHSIHHSVSQHLKAIDADEDAKRSVFELAIR